MSYVNGRGDGHMWEEGDGREYSCNGNNFNGFGHLYGDSAGNGWGNGPLTGTSEYKYPTMLIEDNV
jgi:hypothetical protein